MEFRGNVYITPENVINYPNGINVLSMNVNFESINTGTINLTEIILEVEATNNEKE